MLQAEADYYRFEEKKQRPPEGRGQGEDALRETVDRRGSGPRRGPGVGWPTTPDATAGVCMAVADEGPAPEEEGPAPTDGPAVEGPAAEVAPVLSGAAGVGPAAVVGSAAALVEPWVVAELMGLGLTDPVVGAAEVTADDAVGCCTDVSWALVLLLPPSGNQPGLGPVEVSPAQRMKQQVRSAEQHATSPE